MALLDFCTYDDIRAVLGVENDELVDATLGLEVYDLTLRMEFNEAAPGSLAQYATIKAMTSGRSDAQQAFYEGCRMFAVYAVACRLTSSLPLFAPKDITDSKSTLTRFTDSPYRDVITYVKDEYERLRLKLPGWLAALTSTTVTVTPRVLFGASSPDTDPVTG